MIEPNSLTSDDIGRKVIYTDGVGDTQEGELTSYSHLYVFARFKGPGGEACCPEDLHFAFPKDDAER